MKKTGQIVLISVSVIFSACQALFFHEYLLKDWINFLAATLIAWIVGWHFDRVKHFAKEKKESELSYKQLIECLPEPVIIHHNNIVLYINKVTETMIGAKNKDEIIGKSIFDFIMPEYKDKAIERVDQVMKGKKPTHNADQKLIRLDGRKIDFEVSSLPIFFGGKESVLSIGKDVTIQKEQTAQLLQKSEKLALVGQMAAGIAHEIRNPLTSIKGFIQLFRSNEKESLYFDIVLAELERINSILGEFLVLAKPTAVVFKEMEVTTLINDVVTLINTQSILSNVQIVTSYKGNLPVISGEENQLKQVFINLLKNSIEAMPNGGMIQIKIERKEEWISIYFIDEGIGIPEERIPTLGEPFYTTKEKGTGLGLMTCYKIIENHGGHLFISSKLDEGTTIEVTLPLVLTEVKQNVLFV